MRHHRSSLYNITVFLLISLVFATQAFPQDTTPEANAGDESQGIGEGENGEPKKKPPEGPKTTDVTSSKIIALHNKARGGLEKIKTIQSLAIKGSLKEGKNRYKMTWYFKAPNKYWEESYYRHLGKEYRTVTAYDGEVGWRQNTTPKLETPVKLNKAETLNIARLADFHGPLVDWKEKGHNFAYEGEHDVLKRPAYLLKSGLSDGTILYYYFNKKNFLVQRVGFLDNFAGKQVNADYYVTKMGRVEGILMDNKREYTVGTGFYKTVEYEEIRANIPVDDAIFAMPQKKEYWIKQKKGR